VDEGELQSFTGEFATLRERAEKAIGGLIDFREVAGDGIGALENVSDKSFGFVNLKSV
jgi:hypothetical protein